ncbi:MAG: YceI family protein [Thiobacillus sp.]|jgi:polyisoprenoid-binding protein YceI
MKRLALLTALVAFAASAQAAPETYVIDNSQTVANFSFSYLGMSNRTHKFDKTSGKVVFDRDAKTGSAEVTIDAASINTGIALFNSQMQSADFFDAANYPVITFKSSNMTLDGEQMSLAGNLTIKGVTKPVTLAVTRFKCASNPDFQGDVCLANATVTIKRSDFNMGKYAFLASNDVTLSLTIGAVRESAVQLASR